MKRKSIRTSWFFSFSLVIFLMMAVFTMCSVYLMVSIQKEELEKNISENKFLKNILDEKFISVTDLAADIMYRPAQLFPGLEGEGTPGNSKEVFRLVTELESHCSSNSVIEDIFIYYPEADYIIGANGGRKPRTYYYFYNEYKKEGYESWRTGILEKSTSGFFLFENVQGQTDLLYESRLELSGGFVCNIYIKMDKQGINEVLEEADMNQITELFAMIDGSGRICVSSGDSTLLSLSKDKKPDHEFMARSEGRYFITNQSSYVPVISYYTACRKSAVLQVSGNITILLVAALVLCTLFGLLCALYLIKRNLKPVSILMNKFELDKPVNGANEYEVLGKEVDLLKDNYSNAVHRLEKSCQLLSRAFLEVILNGDQRDSASIISLGAIYGINFSYSCYCVAVCEVQEKEYSQLLMEIFPEDKESVELWQGYVEGRLVTLFNFEAEEEMEADMIQKYMEHMDLLLAAEKKEGRYRITAGGSYHSPGGICFSYAEALYVLESSDGKLVQYKCSGHKIGEKDGNAAFYDFQRQILERNYMEAAKLLPFISTQYMMDPNPFAYRFKKAAIIQLVYEAVRMETSGAGAAQLMEEQFTSSLFTPGTPAKIQENIQGVLEQLAEVTVCTMENDGSLAGQAKTLIESRLADPVLGLSFLAEKLGVSSSHLSRVFKRETGQGIAEFINRSRINASKKLMREGEKSIKAIALSVGYSSDANFIRVFKKYENITPGKYEAMMNERA